MFGRPKHVEHYDRLNPKCASFFHTLVDTLGEPTGTKSSSYFHHAEVRTELDKAFQNGKLAVQMHGGEKACENLDMQIVMGISSFTAKDGMPASLFGTLATVPIMRSLVFGFAPGFASALKDDPYDLTLSSCFIIAGMLNHVEQTEAVCGSKHIWSSFYSGCIEFFGAPSGPIADAGEQKTTTQQQGSIVTRCPACSQAVGVPATKNLRIRCPRCDHSWVQLT